MFGLFKKKKVQGEVQSGESLNKRFMLASGNNFTRLTNENRQLYSWLSDLQAELKKTQAILYSEIDRRKRAENRLPLKPEAPTAEKISDDKMTTIGNFLRKYGVLTSGRIDRSSLCYLARKAAKVSEERGLKATFGGTTGYIRLYPESFIFDLADSYEHMGFWMYRNDIWELRGKPGRGNIPHDVVEEAK